MSAKPLPKAGEWFEQALERYSGTPEYLAERIKYQITERIVEELLAQELPRAELAKKMGVSPAFISRLLNGSPNLTIQTWARMAHALDLDVDVEMPRRYIELFRNRSVHLEQARTPKTFDVNAEDYAGSLAA
jgi:transcriptional regulator with XRE-family HTH domain